MANILLVEDSSVDRRLISSALRKGGYRNREAHSGVDGLCEIYADTPDLVLLDLNLPDISGLDVLRKLIEHPPAEGMPHVFILTSTQKRETVLQAAELGVDAYVLKDRLSMDDLVSRVNQCLGEMGGLQKNLAGSSRHDPVSDPLPSLMTGEETRTRTAGVGDLKSMSETASHVIALTEDPNCDIDDLADSIDKDPVMAERIIRLADSPLFSRGGEIDTLEAALVRIGIRHTRRAVLNVVIIQHFHYSDPVGTWNSFLFWEHSIAVALIASRLARILGQNREYAERAFAAGLLHDLGRAVFASEAREEFKEVIEAAREKNARLLEAERAMLGLDHAEAVGMVLDKWQFAEELSEVIAVHHSPIEEHDDCPDPQLAKILSLANGLANALILGSSGDNTAHSLLPFIEDLGVGASDIVELCEQIPKQTWDLREGLLDKQGAVLWPDRVRDLNAQLKKPFRPLFFAPEFECDRFGIFCKALTDARRHPNPTLAIIHSKDPRTQAAMFRDLYQEEKRLGLKKDPLPLLLLSGDEQLHVPRQLRRKRRIYVSPVPEVFDEFIEAVNTCA